jgi:hypothetical protein
MARDGMTFPQLLDALRALARNIEVKHEHIVRHEPIPPPVTASVVIKRMDGSDAWRGHINPGKGALTILDVPLTNINPKFSPAEFVRLEFRWER